MDNTRRIVACTDSVVITGIGCVTPLGHRGDGLVAAMRAQQTAIYPVILDSNLPLLMGRILPHDFPVHPGDMAGDYTIGSARSAWEMAGLTSHFIDPWRVATVIGSSKGRVGNFIPAKTIALSAFDPETFPGDTLGLEVARAMGLSGPVLNHPAACATGSVCMIRGIQTLQSGEADIVLAGSGEASATSLIMASFKNMGALSDEPMRPFDRRRNGFNPGEGAAVFVLEREADARARGACILANIAGWDYRSDAFHMTAADPSGDTVAYSIRRTIARAGWASADVEYINAHGTGTQLNDSVEGRAINNALPGCRPLVSSIKPNIGHLLGASSSVELALALLCLRAGFVPPTPGLEQPDPNIPLQFVQPGGQTASVHRFLKLSLGFGGHIGVLALEIP